MNGELRIGKRAEQKRRWDRENYGLCEVCGARTWRRAVRCPTHRPQNLPNNELRKEVQRRWLAGESFREIYTTTGLSKGHLSSLMFLMRADGWYLPYRHHFAHHDQVTAS